MKEAKNVKLEIKVDGKIVSNDAASTFYSETDNSLTFKTKIGKTKIQEITIKLTELTEVK